MIKSLYDIRHLTDLEVESIILPQGNSKSSRLLHKFYLDSSVRSYYLLNIVIPKENLILCGTKHVKLCIA